ncbi:MAG: XcyI family restriction endonuclease [Gammaproteobacteria bacterium]
MSVLSCIRNMCGSPPRDWGRYLRTSSESRSVPIAIPAPQLQIDFAFALEQIRGLYLQHALSEAVGKLDIKDIDAELARIVPSTSLTQLATRGLRGELMFAVPSLLSSSPRLLGYYRLLLGFSQKAFYTTQFGLIGFKSMVREGHAHGGPIQAPR